MSTTPGEAGRCPYIVDVILNKTEGSMHSSNERLHGFFSNPMVDALRTGPQHESIPYAKMIYLVTGIAVFSRSVLYFTSG